jgi:hypothetical protein
MLNGLNRFYYPSADLIHGPFFRKQGYIFVKIVGEPFQWLRNNKNKIKALVYVWY